MFYIFIQRSLSPGYQITSKNVHDNRPSEIMQNWKLFFLKRWKGGSGVSCYLFRHVSNHQKIYKKCSTKTRNDANALKHLYQNIFIKNIFNGQELVNILLWVLFNHNFWYISSYTLCWGCIYSLTSACISILTTDNWILRILTKRKTFSTFIFLQTTFVNSYNKKNLKEFSIPEMNQGKHLMMFWCFFVRMRHRHCSW